MYINKTEKNKIKIKNPRKGQANPTGVSQDPKRFLSDLSRSIFTSMLILEFTGTLLFTFRKEIDPRSLPNSAWASLSFKHAEHRR